MCALHFPEYNKPSAWGCTESVPLLAITHLLPVHDVLLKTAEFLN